MTRIIWYFWKPWLLRWRTLFRIGSPIDEEVEKGLVVVAEGFNDNVWGVNDDVEGFRDDAEGISTQFLYLVKSSG